MYFSVQLNLRYYAIMHLKDKSKIHGFTKHLKKTLFCFRKKSRKYNLDYFIHFSRRMKTMYVTRMLGEIVCLDNGCKLPKLRVYRGTQNNNNTLRSIKRNILKSILTWYNCKIKSNDIHYYFLLCK